MEVKLQLCQLVRPSGSAIETATRLVVALLVVLSGTGSAGPRSSRPHRDVPTTAGWVRGYLSPRPRPPHYAYLGVPYASAPLGANRFKVPRPPAPWDGLYEAVHRVRCAQPAAGGADGAGGGTAGTENCLVANVFAPTNGTALPVLVHVHGGRFKKGWGSFQPPLRLIARDVLIVTFNYRLGIFGFLNLGIRDAPGNMGLIDQVAMLHWVRQNIAFFGGNPNNVTVYGTGSGAMAVELLLLSGYTKGLFQRAILESGSALSPSALSYSAYDNAIKAAREFGYKGLNNGHQLLKHFRRISVKRLATTTTDFGPSSESDSYYRAGFLDRDPMEVLKNGHYQHVPLIIAYTASGSTTLPAERFYQLAKSKAFEAFLPNNLAFPDESIKIRVVEYLKEFYIEQNGLKNNAFQIYIEYMNDVNVQYPAVKAAAMHALNTAPPVYLMEFPYRGAYSTADVVGKVIDAQHFDIYHFIFSNDLLNEADEAIVTKLITLWYNFIVYGDPSPFVDSSVQEVWQPVVTRHLSDDTDMNSVLCFSFGNKIGMRQPRTFGRLVFWDHIYAKFYKSHSKTNTISNLEI